MSRDSCQLCRETRHCPRYYVPATNVPATKEGALTRPNGRRHQLAAGSFVNL